MGVRIKRLILILGIVLLLSGCGDFHTARINLNEVDVVAARVNGSTAYYLSKDGVLYSPGADADAGGYVVYQDHQNGIVAENVRTCGIIQDGGYYIDKENNLVVWNRKELLFCEYDQAKEQEQILENVENCWFSSELLIYLDVDNNLFLIGNYKEKNYTKQNPLLIAADVACADVWDELVVWVNDKNQVCGMDEVDRMLYYELNLQINSDIISICFRGDSILTLEEDGDLLLSGNYEALGLQDRGTTVVSIAKGIETVAFSANTLLAIDDTQKCVLWGRCIVNNINETDEPLWIYVENFVIAEEAKNVILSSNCIGYIDYNGRTHIYYSSGWPSFYGNSTSDACVGINREANVWLS